MTGRRRRRNWYSGRFCKDVGRCCASLSVHIKLSSFQPLGLGSFHPKESEMKVTLPSAGKWQLPNEVVVLKSMPNHLLRRATVATATENLGRSWKRFSKSWPMVASCGLPWPSTAVHGNKLRRPDSVPRVVPRVLLRRPLRYAPLSVQLRLERALWLLQSF